MRAMIGGLLGAELSDGQAALRVYLAAGGLVLLGGLLLGLTVRWWRGTRPEPPSLAPLEVMGERRWAKAPEPDKQRLLEQFRPPNADGTTPIIPPEPVDLAALARVPARAFDDLFDDGSRLGDEVRVVGPLVVGGVALATDQPAARDAGDADARDADAEDADARDADARDAEAEDAEAEDAGIETGDAVDIDVDETVAIEADADADETEAQFDATSALVAPHPLEFDEIDDADGFERDAEVIDTGENGLVVDGEAADEPDDEAGADAPTAAAEDLHDVVQQALMLDGGEELVDQTSAGD